MPTLRHYQVEAVDQLIAALATNGGALDASDTGTGKTLVACQVARLTGLPVGIIAPKSVLPSWRHWCREFGLTPSFIVNYESSRTGNTPWLKRSGKSFHWSLPTQHLLVWDECHKCKAVKSLNADMLISAATDPQQHQLLTLSATAATNPLELRALGYVLGLHKLTDFWPWAIKNGVRREFRFGHAQHVYRGGPDILKQIHSHIFPERGIRVRIADLGNEFPDNEIVAEAVETGHEAEINDAYEGAMEYLLKLQARTRDALAKLIRARQVSELAKVPLLAERVESLRIEGNSVVVFLNFHESLTQLASLTGADALVHGQQTGDEREEAVRRFQANETDIIICNIQAGGTGLSLHDEQGGHPRVSLICPGWSAIDMKQCLGRIHRMGGKSKSRQFILYAAGTIEDTLKTNLETKLNNLDLLNDDDVSRAC